MFAHKILFVFLVTALALPSMAFAGTSAIELSQQAMDQCQQGRIATDRESRARHFLLGQQLAEQAIQVDKQYPNGHFAFFCNLGEQMRLDGEVLSAVMEYDRIMDALDTAISLNPDYLDALSAKGMLLIRLPWIMGGDQEKGEVLLKRVVKEDPTAVNARIGLARICIERGEHQEALVYAQDAYTIAKNRQQLDLLPEAQKLLADIQKTTVSR
jgi:tetratricopeptide (TPR) repeat protein